MPPTRRKLDATNSMTMPVGDFGCAKPQGRAARHRRERAAPQPAGGGVASRLSVMNADEPRDEKPKDGTRHETQAGRATPRRDSRLDDGHPMIPALLAETRPATVILLSPSICFTGRRPVVSLTLASRRPAHVFAQLGLRSRDAEPAENSMLHNGSIVRTAVREVIRQTKAILIRDEREPKPFFDDARDFRARIS